MKGGGAIIKVEITQMSISRWLEEKLRSTPARGGEHELSRKWSRYAAQTSPRGELQHLWKAQAPNECIAHRRPLHGIPRIGTSLETGRSLEVAREWREASVRRVPVSWGWGFTLEGWERSGLDRADGCTAL